MPTDQEIDEKDLAIQMRIFEEKTGIKLQFHDKGGHLDTFHYTDPENPENNYNMDSLNGDFFTTEEGVRALRLVNTVLEKISDGEIYYKSKKCLQCGKPSKDRAFCSEKCLNDRISAIGNNKEELDKLKKIAEGKTEDSTI